MSDTGPETLPSLRQGVWGIANSYTYNWAPHLFFGASMHWMAAFVIRGFTPLPFRVPPVFSHRSIALGFSAPLTVISYIGTDVQKCTKEVRANPILLEIARLSMQYDRGHGFRLPLAWDERYSQPIAFGPITPLTDIASAIERTASRAFASSSTREMVYYLLLPEAIRGHLTVRDFDTCVTYLSNAADGRLYMTTQAISLSLYFRSSLMLWFSPPKRAFKCATLWYALGGLILQYNQIRLLTTFERPDEVKDVLQRLEKTGPKIFSAR